MLLVTRLVTLFVCGLAPGAQTVLRGLTGRPEGEEEGHVSHESLDKVP